MHPLTCIFQGFCLDFKSFAVVFKTFQNTYFPEHLSMAVSLCMETVLSKLLRLWFKDELLRNIIESNINVKNSSLIIVQLFMGTSYSFKISKNTVYKCPFKTNDVKMNLFFFL